VSFTFTAIDFETANSQRASVCAVGAVKVIDGQITDSFMTLVRPPEGFRDFAPINTSIHGIHERDVLTAPEWPEVFRDLMEFTGSDVIVGHNAAFDMSVLLNACSVCEIDWPEFDSLCTMRLAKSVLTVPSYSLPWVSEHLGFAPFDHHNPLDDAKTSALVLLAIAARLGVTSFSELEGRTHINPVRSFKDSVEPILTTIESRPDQVLTPTENRATFAN
jgi:DNA polymerase-3 subunit epsilon